MALASVLMCVAGAVLTGCGEQRRESRDEAEAMSVFTIAGASSLAAYPCRPVRDDCEPPLGWGKRWPASGRRFAGACLTRLANGTILLCHGEQLLALSRAGWMRRWQRRDTGIQIGDLLDADAGPDGSVMAVDALGVVRLRSNGDVQRIRELSIDIGVTAIAALPDGGSLVQTQSGLVRLDAAGAIVARPPGSEVTDIATLPDGAFALARSETQASAGTPNPGQVLHLDRNNKLTVRAGGGRGFKEGARATDVNLGDVSAVASASDGALLIGAERGLLRLDSDGRIHTLVDAGGGTWVAASEPRAVTDDGQLARNVRLTKISRIDTLESDPLVLTDVPGPVFTKRLALIAPTARAERLAVALPPANRTLVQHGRVDIVSTMKASGRVALRNGTHLVASKTIALTRGHNRITLPVPTSTKPHVLRVVASAPHGTIASHQLTVIPTPILTPAMITRLENAISLLDPDTEYDTNVDCRPPALRRSPCTINWSEGTAHGVLRLRGDGLSTFQTPRGRGYLDGWSLAFDPLTYDLPYPD